MPPVIAGDQLYLALDSGVVVAYRARDGAEVWRREIRAESPLATDGSRVFIASGETIHAINADGSSAWNAGAVGLTAPMLVHDGWVIAAAKGQLSALRATDGSVVWRRAIGEARERASIEGDNLYVPLEDGLLLALDLMTGADKWQRHLRGAPTEVLPFADRVYVGSADKYFYCLDTDDGDIAWRVRIGAVLRGRPAADAERVYIVALDNLLRAFDRGNGALRWSPRAIPFRPTAGPVVIGSTVAVAGTTNEVRAFAAASGHPSGLLALPQPLATAPAYDSVVLRVAAVTGSLTRQWQLSLGIPGLPALAVEPLSAIPGLPLPIPRPPG
jgi:outer membrane protein assembly factor BamB